MADDKTSTTTPKKDDQSKPSKVPIKDLINAANPPTGKKAKTVPHKRTRK